MKALKTTAKYTAIILGTFVVIAFLMFLRLELAGEVDTAYSVAHSARFNDDDSAYLSRTPAQGGNRKTWTWSGWVKRGNLGTYQVLFGGQADTTRDEIRFDASTDKLNVFFQDASVGK